MKLDYYHFMRKALEVAETAFSLDEVPVGAAIVIDQRIIARAHNLTERLNDVTAHAEMRHYFSSQFFGGKYLKDKPLYVTLEPCVMHGGLYWTTRSGSVWSNKTSCGGASYGCRHPPKNKLSGGIMKEATELLQRFFRKKR